MTCNLVAECPVRSAASFKLSCQQTDLVSVSLSGPCAGDAGFAGYRYVAVDSAIQVDSAGPGVCHVALTFGTGFTYAADVTFVSEPAHFAPCYVCYGGVYATQQTFEVGNPSTTCVDAGADVDGHAGVDGSLDASSEAEADVRIDD